MLFCYYKLLIQERERERRERKKERESWIGERCIATGLLGLLPAALAGADTTLADTLAFREDVIATT